MGVSNCIFGPVFSLRGNAAFSTGAVSFSLFFGNAREAPPVLAYEWYLDGELITEQNHQQFNGTVPCGNHTIGARILASDGWSGLKYLNFKTCLTYLGTVIQGPPSVAQDGTAKFYVMETFSDGSSNDVTSNYTFSSPAGAFMGSVFTPNYTHDQPNPSVDIIASKDGDPDITGSIIVENVLTVVISGQDSVRQEESADYTVEETYYDGYSRDATANYVLSSNAGIFSGPTFIPQIYDHMVNPVVTIIATINERFRPNTSKTVTIITLDFTITGPSAIAGNASGIYAVSGTFLHDGFAQDFTSRFSWSSPDGTFSGYVFTPNITGQIANFSTALSANGGNLGTVTKTVTIIMVQNVILSGPEQLPIGQTGQFFVMENLVTGQQIDISSQYTFSCPEGVFDGNVFTPTANQPSRNSTVIAQRGSDTPLTRSFLIIGLVPGILVVDLKDCPNLNVRGGIVDPVGQPFVSSGNNKVPPAATFAAAYMLASDKMGNTGVSWRFEFNITQLLVEYPNSSQFVLILEARNAPANSLNGIYNLKGATAEMIMTGSPGNYIPSVSGDVLGGSVNFETYMDETIIAYHTAVTFIYTVANRYLQCIVNVANNEDPLP